MSFIAAGVAVAGLGLSLWDRAKQSEADKNLKTQSIAQKGSMAQALPGVGTALQGELGLSDQRRESQTDMLKDKMSSELKGKMNQLRDSGASFSGSYRDTAAAEDMQGSMWQGYEEGKYGIDIQAENQKIGAYSSASSSTADMRKQMDEIEAQINSL